MRYRIVCVTKESNPGPPKHEHIVRVGTGDDAGWNKAWTVAQVLEEMARGNTFYTKDPKTGKIAGVHPWKCPCGKTYIRSAADSIPGNNLDNLPPCKWS